MVSIRRVLVVCALLGLGLHSAGAQSKPNRFASFEAGDLPIILSAPHGGRGEIPGVPERKDGSVRSFNTNSDINTDKLTEQLADALEKKLGKRPYTVIAQFHRRYLDANRLARDAYESKNARAPYRAYHDALATARHDVIRRWGGGLLLDIHGQGADPKAIFRGTQNGDTTSHLVDRFGQEAVSGKTSLFGRMAQQGFRVIPAINSTNRETRYAGGYIVRTYGSGSGGTLDAIQLELGRGLRDAKVIPTTADKLANAIAAFADEYLPDAERKADTDSGKQRTNKVRVGAYSDEGAGRSLLDLLAALRCFESVSVRQVMADDIRSGALADFDVLIHPGGSGGRQGRHLGEEGREKIREFVASGGGYIGICAGAYLASADYEWSLNVLDAKVLDRKHWARGTGMVDIALTDTGQRVLRSNQPQLTVYYGQGPLLAPADREDIADYETVASFNTEVAKNGAPRGVMIGKTAIAMGQYGHGRVLCFSPHPEKTKGLESLVLYAINNVQRTQTVRVSPVPVE
jgi:N-formylglutamate amidohydrolase/glutamine amidotransferase-like uncharacterized protein